MPRLATASYLERLLSCGSRAPQIAGPDPATRSLTVLDTNTSSGAARASILAPNMDCNATELLADHLTLLGVDACANVNAEFLDRVDNCPSAANRPRRTINAAKKQSPAVSISRPRCRPSCSTNKGMMLGEQVLPSSITDFDKPYCCLDNVCE
jgi:hypothetical protein